VATSLVLVEVASTRVGWRERESPEPMEMSQWTETSVDVPRLPSKTEEHQEQPSKVCRHRRRRLLESLRKKQPVPWAGRARQCPIE